MTEAVSDNKGHPRTAPRVREISTEQVWRWLGDGWKDILKAPIPSLFYGACLALLSFVITLSVIVSGSYFLLPPLLAGFLLIAPFLGIGPYSVSQKLEQGETPSLKDSLRAFNRNTYQIFNMGAVLVLCFLAWAMIANLMFVIFHQGLTPANWQAYIVGLLGSWEGAQLLVAGTYAGGLIALAVFAISAVSVPLLIDQPVDVFSAIRTSWSAVRKNILPLLLWAVLLVMIILASFLSLYVGLVIGFPLAAHATWHAYRDLVET